jgi:hypothetical protein
MKKTFISRFFAGSSLLFLLAAGNALSSFAVTPIGNIPNEGSALSTITRAEMAGELAKSNAVTAWGRTGKRIIKSGKAGIGKRFGVIGRASRYDRKPLGCPFS